MQSTLQYLERCEPLPASESLEEFLSVGVDSCAPQAMLAETLAVVLGLLQRASEPVASCVTAFRACLDVACDLPRERRKLGAFLQDVVGRVRAVELGGLLLLPCGWLRSTDDGHFGLLVLMRRHSGRFLLVIPGLEMST